jgi:hypothetical protein
MVGDNEDHRRSYPLIHDLDDLSRCQLHHGVKIKKLTLRMTKCRWD